MEFAITLPDQIVITEIQIAAVIFLYLGVGAGMMMQIMIDDGEKINPFVVAFAALLTPLVFLESLEKRALEDDIHD